MLIQAMTAQSAFSTGSEWIRIDPHIHAPGTLKQDGYGDSSDPRTWIEYAQRINDARPAPSMLGITDYFIPRGYRLFTERVPPGSLPSVQCVFPNIELRLNMKAERGHAINVHLLVSPEDPDHLDLVTIKLQTLTFLYGKETFRCTEEGLRRLGRAHAKKAGLDDEAALREGASQFLVGFDSLVELRRDSWVAQNVLIAVAAGNDGLSGISKDSAFHAQREELAAIADIIFSGQPGDNRFWSGDHQDFESRGYTVKPCLHGSDAHDMASVLNPALDRYCWIRASPTFEGLRQTIFEPIRRVHIGPLPPPQEGTGGAITHLEVPTAAWMNPARVDLNEGLVAIIGARGSGKTALAELLALAADSVDQTPGPASFLERAAEYLAGERVLASWTDGTTDERIVGRADAAGHPRVRYLSQQFVERLSSRTVPVPWDGFGDFDKVDRDELLDEVERVVFDSIPEEKRQLCSNFEDLRALLLASSEAELRNDREDIDHSTDVIAAEQLLLRGLQKHTQALKEKQRDLASLKRALAALPVRPDTALTRAYEEASERLRELQETIAAQDRRSSELAEIGAELKGEIRQSRSWLQALQAKYTGALDAGDWAKLALSPSHDALGMLAEKVITGRAATDQLRIHGIPGRSVDGKSVGLIALADNVAIAKKSLGDDQARAKQRLELERRVAAALVAEREALNKVVRIQQAPARIKEHQTERLEAYERIFTGLERERTILEDLYAPLSDRLAADPRLDKLSFYVYRDVDVRAWAKRGERILDLRKPPFQGIDYLEQVARDRLHNPWRKGTPEEAREALRAFAVDFGDDAMTALVSGASPLHLGQWLFSTDHISVRYGIRYEGVELQNLSPGARGVVLLTLYLAIDREDSRPLIIDQPEENLDPKSVHSYLVPFFRDAARRRQIIMVTHNANLVVTTDADQVIVAESRRSAESGLPNMSYASGGLEDPTIRELVCLYLEGGVDAFRRRGMRYGLIDPPAAQRA